MLLAQHNVPLTFVVIAEVQFFHLGQWHFCHLPNQHSDSWGTWCCVAALIPISMLHALFKKFAFFLILSMTKHMLP